MSKDSAPDPTGRGSPPTPEQIVALREAAGLTQTQCAQRVHGSLRAWQQWEAGDRRMHPGLWELFQIKVKAISIPTS